MRKGIVCLMPLTDLSTIRVGQLRITATCCGSMYRLFTEVSGMIGLSQTLDYMWRSALAA